MTRLLELTVRLPELTVEGDFGGRFVVMFTGAKDGVAYLPNKGGALYMCSDFETGECTSLHGAKVRLVPNALRRLRALMRTALPPRFLQ